MLIVQSFNNLIFTAIYFAILFLIPGDWIIRENLSVIVCYLHASIFTFVSLTGSCTFDEPLGSCGYSQSDDDDLNWDQVNAPVKPASGQGMPSGSSLFCFVSLQPWIICLSRIC